MQRYHGGEWAYIGFDEVGDVADEQIWVRLGAENRCPNKDVIRMMRGTANPGKAGHPWIKRRFINKCGLNGENIYTWTESIPGIGDVTLSRRFIPSKVTDNPIYAQDSQYMAQLHSLPDVLRRQLLYGDWEAGMGQALDELDDVVHFCEPFDPPKEWVQFGAFDWGYNHPWVFGHYCANEDGRIFKMGTYRGRMMSDRAIVERLIERVPGIREFRYIVAGHDCWAEYKGSVPGVTGGYFHPAAQMDPPAGWFARSVTAGRIAPIFYCSLYSMLSKE